MKVSEHPQNAAYRKAPIDKNNPLPSPAVYGEDEHEGQLHSLATMATALAQTLAADGHDPTPIFSQAGIDLGSLHREGLQVPSWKLDLAWEKALQLTQDLVFGIKVTQSLHPGYWGVVGHCVYASATLADAWNRYARYSRIVSQASHVTTRIKDQHLIFSAIPTRITMPPERALTLAVMATKICRDLHQPGFIPTAVSLAQFSRPLTEVEQARVRGYFGCEVLFDQHAFQVAIPVDTARQPLSAANEFLARHLDEIAERYLAVTPHTVKQDVEQAITKILPRTPSLSVVASQLGVCPRSLQRRLREEDSNFQLILDRVRRTLIGHLLTNSGKPLKEIAYLSGFTDPSNFSRACRHWFGKSPTAYRESMCVFRRSSDYDGHGPIAPDRPAGDLH